MSLKRLTIFNCPKLTDLPEGKRLPPILEYLDLRHCHNLQQLPSDLCNLKSLTEFRVEGCKMLKSFPHMDLPGTLKRLVVQGCDALTTIPMKLVGNNSALEYLEIGRCSSLETFLDQGEFSTTLINIRIYNCKKLKLLPHGIMSENTKLEYFEMDNCPSVKSFPDGQLPTTLKRLQVSNCNNLSSLAANLPSLGNLEYLEVSGCPNLECFPSGAWRILSLRCIKIEDSENLKSLPDGFYNLKNLKELEIRDCPNLEYLPKQGLPSSLRSLSITECKNLSSPDGWKLHKLKSLKFLTLGGFLGFVSFSSDYLLPHSITEL
ncbi:putative disease resistance protein [Forsythia ovata]|uniref:Disease resistance protein n=1 Tax=Forsythia ovata TaxID=205694 RepID=A0ABD1TAD6_9LAMI